MSRVHTILSLLAEDHAPAALRPSILIAVDWPTVAEEAPATGDDSYIACVAAGLLGGKSTRDNLASLGSLASLAARLATVAASLTATGDKAMATHATALWGAAAALVGMPTAALRSRTVHEVRSILGEEIKGHEHLTLMHMARAAVDTIGTLRDTIGRLANKAADIVPGAKCSTPDEQATLIATALDRVSAVETERVSLQVLLGKARSERDTARAAHDKALADIHALRDILKVPEGGNLVDHASKTMDGFPRGLLMAAATSAAKITGATMSVYPAEHAGIIGDALRLAESSAAENVRLRAQVDRMIAAMREDGFIESSRPR